MSNKQLDLIAIGRACIDLNAVEYNRPMEETVTFAKYVGGSPANIAIGASKLGLSCGFVGKIPDDQHGRFITNFMHEVGVNTSHLILDTENRKSGLAFTEILSPAECDILMYRDNVADLYLRPNDIDEEYIKLAKMIVISGTALSQSPSREAIFKVVSIAHTNNISIVFELDYRPYTWKNVEETSIYYTLIAEQSDIIIGTREEFDMLEAVCGKSDDITAEHLLNHQPKLIVIKHGIDGSCAFTKEGQYYRANAYQSNVLKTFGAGDSYAAAFLYALSNKKGIEKALNYGSASAALVVSKHSSSEAMPTVQDIESLMKEQQ
ncbi:MAG: 5-dehydro-2-deoxygluconokinase [Vagococcus sp.]